MFPDRPSLGFSVTLLVLGAGTIIGPASVGVFADTFSLQTALLCMAGLAALTIAAVPSASRLPLSRRTSPTPSPDGVLLSPDGALPGRRDAS